MPASYLKIGGELLQDAILTSVTVHQALNQHWWCYIECRQTEDKRFPIEQCLGKDLELITYDESGAETKVFEGFVLKGKLDYEIFGSSRACITGVTRSYKLNVAPREAYFRKQTLSTVGKTLAGAQGLAFEVRCQSKPPKNYVQWGETDFAFLTRLADDHKAWLRPTAAGLEVLDSFQKGQTLLWRDEDGLYSFRMKGRLGPASFGGTHYDARRMQSVTLEKVGKPPEVFGSSGPLVEAVKRESGSKLPAGSIIADGRTATGGEFQELLERESIRSLTGGMVGTGVSRNEGLRPGDSVEIKGVLDAAGTYGIVRVEHHWSPTGYQNEFWCTPAKTWLSPEPPQPRRMQGVVSARVAAHNDPRKMGRIQVQYDWQESGQTAWARMVTPHAGADRGFVFLPEIGDEVLIAFENGDPERPYILGSLWNGVDQAPRQEFWGGDVEPNDVKRIVTKSGHRIQLSDKPGKESIVVATPQSVKIGMLENADETSRPMMLLHSAGDVFFSAPKGRIHFHSALFSRETGTEGEIPKPLPAKAPALPMPDFAAQAAALRSAAASGTALCAP